MTNARTCFKFSRWLLPEARFEDVDFANSTYQTVSSVHVRQIDSENCVPFVVDVVD